MRLYSISSANVSLPAMHADAPSTRTRTPWSSAKLDNLPATRCATAYRLMAVAPSFSKADSSSFDSVSTSLISERMVCASS